MLRSYHNLLELTGESPTFNRPLRQSRLPRSITVAGISVQGQEDGEPSTNSVTSDAPSSVSAERIIIVANQLPLIVTQEGGPWDFKWDEDSLHLQLKEGLPRDMEVLHVGCLKVTVEPEQQEEVSAMLLDKFNCVPVFLSEERRSRFYHGFCKQQLWPLFHYMLPLTPEHGGRFDRSLWQAYVLANRMFADKVMEVISPEDDYVWIHDYHLMVLPTFLRKRFPKTRLGFFLHSPFPSSEIYRTLPVRDEILRALLNSDLIGFHTFDYARHFLSCCSRMLGLEYESKRGYIGLDYYGRTVGIKIMPVGIHMGQLSAGLKLNDTEWRIGELASEYKDKLVLLGVDDMDIFKGIGLKLLAMESLLKEHPEWIGRAVLVQIANPARGVGRDVEEVKDEVYSLTQRINTEYGREGYQPIVLLDRHVPLYERLAFYTIAQVCVVTAVRDGMNLIPYEYIVVRQNAEARGMGSASVVEEHKRSMLVISEFIGCSPSLSGAIRVNPWNTEAVGESLNMALTMPEAEQQMRHEKHYRYISSHDVAYWAQSFMGDLFRTCQQHVHLRCYGIGFGLGFRIVALDPNFKKLMQENVVAAYRKAKSRAILLDYDGTMMPQTSINKRPSEEVIAVLNRLTADPTNIVFIVSGRGRDSLSEWFAACPKLGIAAEHGYFYRWHQEHEWETAISGQEFQWKDVALPVMELYAESTDGSYIELKESSLVWHYRDADPDFGSWQAKELLDHLESVLASEPVAVKSGNHIVEVKPQGVSKGEVVDQVLTTMEVKSSPPDFVLCIGDDRSDEDMFQRTEDRYSEMGDVAMFACTVGQKPSKARYFLDDTVEVMAILNALAEGTTRS